MRRSIEQNIDYDIEYRVVTPSGDLRWVHIRGQTVYRPDGTPVSMAGVSLDITARKHAEEHRSLLAGELTHRVKNTLTPDPIDHPPDPANRPQPGGGGPVSRSPGGVACRGERCADRGGLGQRLHRRHRRTRPRPVPEQGAGARACRGRRDQAAAARCPGARHGTARTRHQRGEIRGPVQRYRPGPAVPGASSTTRRPFPSAFSGRRQAVLRWPCRHERASDRG